MKLKFPIEITAMFKNRKGVKHRGKVILEKGSTEDQHLKQAMTLVSWGYLLQNLPKVPKSVKEKR